MGFFDLFRGMDVNEGLKLYKKTEGAVLLDVRSEAEYKSGHIPGSVNVPVDTIDTVRKKVPDLNTPIFSYCLSGARSTRAVTAMKQMGYTNVQNIGGINRYRGPQE